MVIPASNAAVPDPRYATSVSNGALAELFGLGPSGARWGQVTVIVIGTWIAGTSTLLLALAETVAGTSNTHPTNVLIGFASALSFVFSAITAIRSFQGGLYIAVASALFYSAFATALRIATAPDISGVPSENWLRSGAGAFSWMTLTMCALQFAVAESGLQRWVRMAGGLYVAALVQSVIVAAMYFDILGSDQMLSYLFVASMGQMMSPILWTAAFWFGLTKVAR